MTGWFIAANVFPMKKTLPCLTAALIASFLTVWSPQAFGMGGDYGEGKDISHPDTWPSRLVELAKLPLRVAGYFINQNDYLAFKGNTAQFQSCLDTCAAMAEFGSTTLRIHKGKGEFQPLHSEKKPVSCDWRLDVINQEWGADKPLPKGPKYTMELHVWLESAVDVAAIKVPAAVKTIRE